jgi:HK97 family phage prohead protease
MAKTFILNDESTKNSYGFYTLNSGINLERFRANSVILSNHDNTTGSVIGRWENLRVEGSQLMADAVFDTEDAKANEIAGKVERGFLKGCSMGLNFDWDHLQKNVDSNDWELLKCELMEASIVAIPSNANAVKLYAPSGELVKTDEIKLKLAEGFVKPQNQNENMSKLMLSAIAMVALAIQDTEDPTKVALAVEGLVKENADLKAKVAQIALAEKQAAKLKAEALINQAIVEGKLTADVKDAWVGMAEANLEAITTTIEGMKGAASLAGQVVNNNAGSDMTEEKFMQLSAEAQEAWVESNPEAYKKLFA